MTVPASQIMNRFERNVNRAKRKARLWAYDRIEFLVKKLQKIKIESISVSHGIVCVDGDYVDFVIYKEKYCLPLTQAISYSCDVADFYLIGYPKKDAELFEEIANIVEYCAKNDINLDIKF